MPIYFHKNPDVISRRIGDEIVLVNLETDRIYTLNRTGARLWELIEAGHNNDQIERQMLKEFAVDESELSAEIQKITDEMQAEELIRLGN